MIKYSIVWRVSMTTELDRQGLAEILNVEHTDVEREVIDITGETPLPEGQTEEERALFVINENIRKANEILDLCQREMLNGNFNARLVEVASFIINSVNAAAAQLILNKNANKSLQIKERMVLLKSKELHLREKYLENKNNEDTGSQRLIITDRETILKYLKEKPAELTKEIVTTPQSTNGG
jgi:hypothetical protein